jgi:O-antigen/teichoic acid export membrane protein
MVGQFALGFAVVGPVVLFSQFQLRALQATDATHAEFRPGDYIALRLISTVLALGVIAGLAAMSGYRRETALVVMLAGAAKACESMSDVFYGHMQQYERMFQISRSMIIRGLLSLGALAAAVRITRSAVWGAAALAFVWASVLVLHDIPTARALGRNSAWLVWDWPAMGRLCKKALPLGVVTMLASLNTNIPRYIIAHRLGEGSLGVFAAIASLQTAAMVLVSALGQAATPRLARYHLLGNDRSFRSLMTGLLALAFIPGAALVGVAIGAGNVVPSLLFGPAYGHDRALFVWLSVATGLWLLTSILGFGATASGRIKFQPYALAVVAATSAICCWVSIPRLGVVGAAISTTAAAAAALALYGAGMSQYRSGTARQPA